MKRYGKLSSNHAYQIGTDKGEIIVHANNRDQAARIASREGFKVNDVNMIG